MRTANNLLTFIVKSVDSVDGGTLVVAAEKKEVLWIFDLKGKETKHYI